MYSERELKKMSKKEAFKYLTNVTMHATLVEKMKPVELKYTAE